jgi:hypothetical protein
MSEIEKPPIFKSWTGWYILILSVLGVQIIIYRILTVAFS